MRARAYAITAVITLGLGLFPLTAAAAPAAANTAFNLSITPTSQLLNVKPGGSVTTKIEVRNQESAPEHLKVTIMKLSATGENGAPTIGNAAPSDPSLQWASFSVGTFDAAPNVWTPFNVTFTPPANAAFGYSYAIIVSRNQTAQQVRAVNTTASVASIVLLNVEAPGAVRAANLVQFSTPHNVSEFLPATFTVRMHNAGNVFVAPRGDLFINKGGKQIAEFPINQIEGNILPHSNRVYQAQWTDGTPAYKTKTSHGQPVYDKQGQPVTSLDWSNFSPGKLRFGHYQAKLLMVYNNGRYDVPLQASLSFWVIPWRIIALVLVLLVLVGVGLWVVVVRPLRKRVR